MGNFGLLLLRGKKLTTLNMDNNKVIILFMENLKKRDLILDYQYIVNVKILNVEFYKYNHLQNKSSTISMINRVLKKHAPKDTTLVIN